MTGLPSSVAVTQASVQHSERKNVVLWLRSPLFSRMPFPTTVCGISFYLSVEHAAFVRAELERHSVEVVPLMQVERMEGLSDKQVHVLGIDGFERRADLVLVAVGV